MSVFDKTNLIEFAEQLIRLHYQIVSTGGSARILRKHKIPVTDVSEVTGYPEMMTGRVKTLHPLIHGGILCRKSNPEDMQQAEDNNIVPFDLICVNLYPFEKVAENKTSSLDDIIENIDIGGPAMLRASAKNYRHITAVCDPADYSMVIDELNKNGDTLPKTREMLAVKVFKLTAEYDAAISRTLSGRLLNTPHINLSGEFTNSLRYGENPHQQAEIYRFRFPGEDIYPLADAEILNGKDMSYNNYQDLDSGIQSVSVYPPEIPTVAVIKHNNPCGYATGKNVTVALEKAWDGDPVSAFGGVVICNTMFTLAAAHFLKSPDIIHNTYTVVHGKYIPQPSPTGKFTEIIAAPDFEPAALEFLRKKSKTLRLVKYPIARPKPGKTAKLLSGTLLIQDKDITLFDNIEVKTKATFPFDMEKMFTFGIAVTRQLISNGIGIVQEYEPGYYRVVGIGAGQPNRIDAIRKLAAPKVIENLKREYAQSKLSENIDAWVSQQIANMVMFSDAFFPFDDSVRETAALGIRYIVQPGGSNRDVDSIKACDELGVAMAFTGERHFKH